MESPCDIIVFLHKTLNRWCTIMSIIMYDHEMNDKIQ